MGTDSGIVPDRATFRELIWPQVLPQKIGTRVGRGKLPPNLRLCQIQTKLDILRHSIRKLQTYEEIHIVVTRYVRCDGVYCFLSAGGNDRYGRTY